MGVTGITVFFPTCADSFDMEMIAALFEIPADTAKQSCIADRITDTPRC